CNNPFSQSQLERGYVYCAEGHVLVIAPIYSVDPRNLRSLASACAQNIKARGGDVFGGERGPALWRALL
ncbi:MAG TPA: hypothetical protein VFU47_07900, partial [Armatimonadota bacterium]|nr:hypothetical protein [Armatimonadota bacterium]